MSYIQKKISLFLVLVLLTGAELAQAELAEEPEDIKDHAPKPAATAPVDLPASKPALSTKPSTSPEPKSSAKGEVSHDVKTEARPDLKITTKPARPRSKNSKLGVVKFWSKSLSGFRDQGSLALEEDVVVTQDDIRLEADKATIFFEKGSNDVREVHAVGAVKFLRTDPETGQPIRAEGKEAVFNNAKRIVTMKGEPVLHRGDDTVRGKVIYYDLTNGWVKADRVEGVVQPANKKAGSK